jgi:hypothetical protein
MRAIIDSTSARDIGFAAVPACADAEVGAAADGLGAAVLDAGAAAAWEDPNIADTMLPKMLIVASTHDDPKS